jgi:hypothetical protein
MPSRRLPKTPAYRAKRSSSARANALYRYPGGCAQAVGVTRWCGSSAAWLRRETHRPALVERNSAARLLAFPHRWVMPSGSREGNGSAPGVRMYGRTARWGGGPSIKSAVLATAHIRNRSTTSALSTAASTECADIAYGGSPVNSCVFVIILCSNRFRCQPVQIDDDHLVADASNWDDAFQPRTRCDHHVADRHLLVIERGRHIASSQPPQRIGAITRRVLIPVWSGVDRALRARRHAEPYTA